MEFRLIPEAPFYAVSDEGHVMSISRLVKTWNGKTWCYKNIPKIYPMQEKDIRGYKNISIIQYTEDMRPVRRYMRQIHRLVLETFKPVIGMEDLQVNHKNGDKSDNRLENLEWVTPTENTRHSINTLHKHKTLQQNGEDNSMAKLTEEDVRSIRELATNTNISRRELADQFNVSISLIGMIIRNKVWTYIL